MKELVILAAMLAKEIQAQQKVYDEELAKLSYYYVFDRWLLMRKTLTLLNLNLIKKCIKFRRRQIKTSSGMIRNLFISDD